MPEVYQPTQADIARLRNDPDQFKVSGDGVFPTLQGEGITTGKPAVFFRLNFCNLACGFTSGWKCDTWYTWDKTRPEFWKEPEDWPIDYAVAQIESAWSEGFSGQTGKRLVITGGEPLMQQKKIAKLLERMPGWAVEIETNGTIMPIPELSNCQFNCSPKLDNSGNTRRRRYKPEVLRHINSLPNSQFKFVVVEPSDMEEIQGIVDECRLDSVKVLIMPEGQTVDEVDLHAGLVRDEVAKRNWQLTMRSQLIWFGSKRRT